MGASLIIISISYMVSVHLRLKLWAWQGFRSNFLQVLVVNVGDGLTILLLTAIDDHFSVY